jgi:hypothetical protein
MTKEILLGDTPIRLWRIAPLHSPVVKRPLRRCDEVRIVCYTITPGMHRVDVGDLWLAQISEKGGALCHRG